MTKFAFVAAERANHAVSTLCRVVGASVSGFYAWLRAIPSRQSRAEAEAALRGHISRIFAARHRVYGAPRIHAELRREGHRHARRRIERLIPTRAKADSFWGFQTSASLTPWRRIGGLPCGQGLRFAPTMTPPGFGA